MARRTFKFTVLNINITQRTKKERRKDKFSWKGILSCAELALHIARIIALLWLLDALGP